MADVKTIFKGTRGITPDSPRSKMAFRAGNRNWSLQKGYSVRPKPSLTVVGNKDGASVSGSAASNKATGRRQIIFKVHKRALNKSKLKSKKKSDSDLIKNLKSNSRLDTKIKNKNRSTATLLMKSQ